jgi:hypothetical protein
MATALRTVLQRRDGVPRQLLEQALHALSKQRLCGWLMHSRHDRLAARYIS